PSRRPWAATIAVVGSLGATAVLAFSGGRFRRAEIVPPPQAAPSPTEARPSAIETSPSPPERSDPVVPAIAPSRIVVQPERERSSLEKTKVNKPRPNHLPSRSSHRLARPQPNKAAPSQVHDDDRVRLFPD